MGLSYAVIWVASLRKMSESAANARLSLKSKNTLPNDRWKVNHFPASRGLPGTPEDCGLQALGDIL